MQRTFLKTVTNFVQLYESQRDSNFLFDSNDLNSDFVQRFEA